MYSFTDPAAPSRLHSRAARQSGRPVLHSTYGVLAGNISFPLTANTSGNGKKGILAPREIKIMPLSKHKLPGFV